MPKDSSPDTLPAEGRNNDSSVTSEARGEAEHALEEAGFVRSGGEWIGSLQINDAKSVAVRISLPARFPDVLPEISVDRKSLPKRIAHVEKTGKICIAPSSGVLIDADRPADLIIESLQLAKGVLQRGLSGESDEDLQREFLAYWESTDQVATYSLCSPDGSFRELVVNRVTGIGFLKSGPLVIADRKGDVERWAQNLDAKHVLVGKAAFLPFQTSLILRISVFGPQLVSSANCSGRTVLLETLACSKDGWNQPVFPQRFCFHCQNLQETQDAY